MKLLFCIECGDRLMQQTRTNYQCSNGHEYFNNPSSSVAVVMMRGDSILVSKRAFEPAKGLYDLPGGFLEYGEDPYMATRREILEETGIALDNAELTILDAYSGEYTENIAVCDVIVLAENWQGTPIPADDSEALEWRSLSFLETTTFYPQYPRLRKMLEDRL